MEAVLALGANEEEEERHQPELLPGEERGHL
jgi:hypothetical protein